mmetsp:Transcript_28694/g.95261  ORF Transcript_28694/g.95261 Transcript_28694/m.95261 type:complete len:964 (+) Transcript_28694:65-2956(+)
MASFSGDAEPVHITVVVDTTGSMGTFCTATGLMLQQLFVMLDVLFQGTAQVDLVAYEDYCDGERLLRSCAGTRAELQEFAGKLKAGGGGDCPEAAKTALNHVAEKLREKNSKLASASHRNIVVHYTDAPPHHGDPGQGKSNNLQERKALGGKTPGFDFVEICKAFKAFGTQVITFMPPGTGTDYHWFWALLGECVVLPNTEPNTITKFTMGVLLQLMGQEFEEVNLSKFKRPSDLSTLKDEMQNIHKVMVVTPSTLEPHPALQKDLMCLIENFKESTPFQDLVFDALKELFVPEKILAMTYNSVLGALWRLVCKQREDPRLQPLCDALGSCCQTLTGDSQVQLRAWVDESYNQLEEIKALVGDVPEPLSEGILVLDVKGDDMPTKEEMRSLIHSPIPGVLCKVQGLLTRLLVVKRGELPVRSEDEAPMYVPLGLKDKDLFSVISHLLTPGLMLSVRPAAMMAILAHCSGNVVLQGRAKNFLEAWKGKWIPPEEKAEDYPEILNSEFVRLVVRVPEFLTDEERTLYQRLHHITRVRRAANLRLHVCLGFTPKMQDLHADTKLHCSICKENRSFTLMVDGQCGKCLDDPALGLAHPEKDKDRSHLVECRTCNVLYAVVCTEDLNIQPKCHYCRNNEPAAVVACVSCGNRFCAPTAASRVEGFVCAPCTLNKEKGTQIMEIELSQLLEQNPTLMACLGFKESSRKLLFDRIGLFKLWMGHKDEFSTVAETQPEALVWAGKPVRNVVAVIAELTEGLKGRLADTCNLCFEEKPLRALQSACGRCKNLACASCLGRWYGQLRPGRLYVPSEGLCAFCKCTPKAATLRAFNRTVLRLTGRRTLELDAGMYYGWCRTCFKIKPAVPRDCARETPELEHFECGECVEARVLAAARTEEEREQAMKDNTKECPGCKAPTVKLSGCNHITCTQCPVHWCWQCGEKFLEGEIYDHMQDEHGTIGLDDDLDFDSD